jgi:hypothetical protein
VAATSAKILWPREHGTYGELLFPLMSALLLARPGRAAWGLSLLAVGGFLAHEGFSVLAGARGLRAKRDAHAVAWRSVAIFGGAALLGAAWAAPSLTSATLTAVGVAAGLSVASVALAWFGREHTLLGELMAALTLSSWCVPVGLAGGVSLPVAAAIWLIWTGVFGVATCAVHLVIARSTRRPVSRALALGWLLGMATPLVVWSFARAGHVPDLALTIPIPALVTFVALVFAPVRGTHLRQIGWSVIGVSGLTLALMAVAIR